VAINLFDEKLILYSKANAGFDHQSGPSTLVLKPDNWKVSAK
jgi:hypothetical protein